MQLRERIVRPQHVFVEPGDDQILRVAGGGTPVEHLVRQNRRHRQLQIARFVFEVDEPDVLGIEWLESGEVEAREDRVTLLPAKLPAMP